VEVHGLLVAQGVLVDVEAVQRQEVLGVAELAPEEVREDLGVGDDFRVLQLGTDDQSVQDLLHFFLEVLLLLVLDVLEPHHCFLALQLG
jgi:hypothetical protein